MRRHMLASIIVLWSVTALASIKDDIGYTDLQAMLGEDTPTGAGISATMVEALYNGGYVPSISGKTITPMSPGTTTSTHATAVAGRLCGSSGISSGVDNINVWEASHWVGSGFLKTNQSSAPTVETSRVQNHSWISYEANEQYLRRFDYAINRDKFVATVGLGNEANPPIPVLMAHSYNAIVVGKSNGIHSIGDTRQDTSGRIVPHIVAPENYTSFGTPLVASAAALLLETADNTAGLENARHNPEVIKAVLMAGATKDEFASWSRTHERPLDDTYGAGELNVFNSYNILVAQEQQASGMSDVTSTGWDLETSDVSGRYYFFDVEDGVDLSAVLTWNREITTNPAWSKIDASLANLDLKLYTADGYEIGDMVDQSISTVDNVEHIYQMGLLAGRYALEVSGADSATYALAWQAVPEPTTVSLALIGAITILHRRRRGA